MSKARHRKMMERRFEVFTPSPSGRTKPEGWAEEEIIALRQSTPLSYPDNKSRNEAKRRRKGRK